MSRNIPLGFLSNSSEITGYSWNTGQPDGQIFFGAAYANLANAKFFGFGTSAANATTTQYRYSVNGTTGWTTGTMPDSRRWGRAATNGTRVLAMALDSQVTGYTDNGTTWTTVNTGANISYTDLIWDGTRFLATANNAAQNIWFSTNGTTWGNIDIGAGFQSIAYDGSSRYFAGPVATSSTVRSTTSNPTVESNWVNVTMPASRSWRQFTFGAGLWLAFDEGTTNYATSPNGTTWTARTLPQVYGQNSSYHKVLFYEGFFYFLGYTTAPLLYRSADGITWELIRTFTGTNPRNTHAWAATPSVLLGIGAQSDSVSGTGDETIVGVK